MKSKDFSTLHGFPTVTSKPQLATGRPQCINLPFPKFIQSPKGPNLGFKDDTHMGFSLIEQGMISDQLRP